MSVNIKPKMIAYYVKVARAEIIETELEGEIQRLEVPDKTYKNVIYLVPEVPREFVEEALEKQMRKIVSKMWEKENETGRLR